ncbi:MAG: S-methyl-5-thioribose-1-phosphate isomerase [Bdellovibrionaceae bacterium]|nr:S-methyl-5-thioribose-1-phosphate isomerase [Bdellovibrio sp.]
MMTLRSLALEADIDENKITIRLLDQTLLPQEEKWLTIETNAQMIEAIKSLRVRGAPLIGVAASLMVAQLAVQDTSQTELLTQAKNLYEARPTAVNLMICIDRMTKRIKENFLPRKIVDLAVQIFDEDVILCQKIAANGAALIEDGDQILTHCNTGGLATAGVGTALGVIRLAHQQGKKIHVYIDETRPLLQGGRLTAWELKKLNIPCTLITDSTAAHLMSLKKITKAIVGSDRIAVNGDFANKIGTYSVAVNCHYHEIPFYVAAPYTTVDTNCQHGDEIPIEQRAAKEVQGVSGSFGEVLWAPSGVAVYNPAFDVTPAKLVSAWILDRATFNKKDVDQGALKSC